MSIDTGAINPRFDGGESTDVEDDIDTVAAETTSDDDEDDD